MTGLLTGGAGAIRGKRGSSEGLYETGCTGRDQCVGENSAMEAVGEEAEEDKRRRPKGCRLDNAVGLSRPIILLPDPWSENPRLPGPAAKQAGSLTRLLIRWERAMRI